MTTASAAHAIDTSILSLILSSDIVGKMVFLLLALASIWSWAIIIHKYVLFNNIEKKMRLFEAEFWKMKGLDQFGSLPKNHPANPLSMILDATMKEYSESKINEASCQGRIEAIMSLIAEQQVTATEQRLGFLAIVGSSAPFIGLFGTVWGIMHSFQSIAHAKNATLAVVAPGIAEALLATAIGLFAAIPATVFYNYFVGRVDNVDNTIRAFSKNLYLVISKTMDKDGEK